MFAILGILAIACAVGVVMISDDSSASTYDLTPKEDGIDYGKVSTTISYSFKYVLDETQATYKAVLEDSDGNVKSGAITSGGEGTIYKGGSARTINVTLPSTADDYVLRVTVTEGEATYVRTAYVRAVEAVTLTVNLENTSAVSRTFYAYFYVLDENGEPKQVGDEDTGKKTVKVDAHGTATVTHDYVVRDLESTTYWLQPTEDATLGGEIKGLGQENAKTFYTSANDYKMIEYLCIAVLVILLIVAIWIYRKPIRNFGKPKGRR